MIYVAFAVLALAAVVLLAAFSAVRWMQRALDRKDTVLLELLDRAMLLAGKPWNAPPAQGDHLDEADRRNEERRAELAAMFDGIVEEPQPGGDYSGGVDDLLPMWDVPPEPLLVDTRDLDVL